MNLHELMDKNNLTGYALSKKSGVSYSVVKDILQGKRNPEKLTGRTIFYLSKSLGITMEDFIEIEVDELPDRKNYLFKRDYFTDILRGRKNAILCKGSALEFYGAANSSSGSAVEVFACGNLPSPFITYPVRNFKNIAYEKHDGILVTTLNQTINDMLEDGMSEMQPLYEALSDYYYTHGSTFEGIEIKPENRDRFCEAARESLEYYEEG